MKSIYLAKGHNSWTNKTLTRVFSDYAEANSFLEGLTDSSVKMYSSENVFEAFNLLLREVAK